MSSYKHLVAGAVPARLSCLNLENKADDDGAVRGRVLNGQQSLFSRFVALSTLVLFVSWPYIMVSLLITSFFSRTALAVLTVLASTLLLPAQLLWQPFTDSFMFFTWQEYFDFGWTSEKILGPDTPNVIFATVPHGVIPFGPMLAKGACSVLYPGRACYALAASTVFYLPGYKHFMRWVGCMPASRENLAALLQKGSVAVMMGGIAEMFMLSDDQEEVILHRRGLMRTAIETGAPLVPVYHLGNSRVLKFGPAFLRGISRRLRTSLGLMFGRWGLPIPIPHPIHMLVGAPIPPGKLTAAPGAQEYEAEMDAAVKQLSITLEREMRGLYERHRHIIPGWQDRPLVIH